MLQMWHVGTLVQNMPVTKACHRSIQGKEHIQQKPEAHFTMATNNEAMEEDPTLEASGMPLDLAGAVKMIATEENTSIALVEADTDAFLDSI